MANEDRLIDVEKLKRILQNMAGHLKALGKHKEAEVIESVIKWVDSQTTVDAVEVRCSECKMRCPESVCIAKHCTLTGIPVDDDDFCSYGERREGE